MHQMSIDSVHWGDWTRVGGLFWRTPQRCHQQEKWPSCTCPLQPSQLYTGGHEGCYIECRLSQPGIVSKRQKMIFGWSFLKNGTVGRTGLRLRAVPLQSVKSKLSRTGESELAERETDFIFTWISHLLMIYEINHIWSAEMKWKWRNDHRSEHNLCNCVKKPEKKIQDFNRVWTCDPAISVRCSTNWAMKLLTLGAGFIVSGFIAQLVEHRTGIARSRIQTLLKSWIFFQASLRIA